MRLDHTGMATRLFHISDVHFGVEDQNALAEVARAIVDEQPDALVCTGDLTQRAKHSEYAAAERWFGQIDVPVWLDPGNHDMPYFNLIERFRDPYRRYRALRDAVARPGFQTNDVALFGLKTTVRSQNRWPWSDGHVTRKAIDATLRSLDANPSEGRVVIVTGHHPLLGKGGSAKNATIGGEQAFEELAAKGADAFLSGHIHFPINEMREHGTQRAQLIGAGTLSTRLRHGAPPSYNVLTCQRGRPIEVEVRSF